MKKILFRKLLTDYIRFFLLALVSTSIIIWVFQAVNYLDIMIEDGRDYLVYINFSLLNFPKIMSKILAFGASSSKNSMNKKLASFVANKIAPQEAILIDLNDYEMPIYSDDRKKVDGIPEKAYEFKNLIKASDGIIISLAEHNGSYTAAFKNIYDWISVIEEIVWNYKPILLLSASNGSRGGKSVIIISSSSILFFLKYAHPDNSKKKIKK